MNLELAGEGEDTSVVTIEDEGTSMVRVEGEGTSVVRVIVLRELMVTILRSTNSRLEPSVS
jgi:hypothetical protein